MRTPANETKPPETDPWTLLMEAMKEDEEMKTKKTERQLIREDNEVCGL